MTALSLGAIAAGVNRSEAQPRFGLMTDLGVPDGATASLVMRPMRAIRLNAGVSHNLVSTGVRGGITLAPISWWVTPTLSLDYGRYFDGDANRIARVAMNDPGFSSPLLDNVGYDYANAHGGLEFGRTWFTFYIHAGMSRITTQVRGIEAAIAEEMDADSDTTISFSKDPTVKLYAVSARLGLVFYFAR